ncbi:MAG: endonuclease dU [Candidatus Methanospirareceae archaeon]
MVLHVNKKGIRVLGIAESFRRGYEKSVLAGIVMRSDFIIDGVGFAEITVGGMDATEGILRLYESLQRDDISVMMLNGCVISWFNIVDINEVYNRLQIPLICVTYEESEGLEEHLARHFEAEERDSRIEAYKRLGDRVPVALQDRFEILIRFLGIEEAEAGAVLKKFTTHGKVPEPLRVAKMVARALLRSGLAVCLSE